MKQMHGMGLPEFHPHRDTRITISGVGYRFLPHPLFPDDEMEVYAIEGGEATVFRVQSEADGTLRALKVPRAGLRSPGIAATAHLLTALKDTAGFALADRLCLAPTSHPFLLKEYPELTYAVLMPWLDLPSWNSIRHRRDLAITYADGLFLATATAQALWHLEARHMAHCDLAGSNVAVDLPHQRIELLDLEHVYAPQVALTKHTALGTRGYQHRTLAQHDQWGETGDRFAGAVVLTEMLVWGDPLVRALVPQGAESLFQPAEVQMLETPIWREVRTSLWNHWPDALALFDAAWSSPTLADCPEMSAWATCLLRYATRAGLA